MYLLGLRALGHEVFYIEDTGECVYDPVLNTRATDPGYGTTYIHQALEPFGLGDRWTFVNYDGSYHGRSADDVRRYCADADLFINLSGGSWFWRDEYARIPRKIFIDSDPAFTQLAIAKAEPWYVEFFQRFDHLFTFGANIGTPASPIPTGAFTWHKTWQPVTLDDWHTDAPPGDCFTTVMTWQIESFTDVGGNKDQEFIKFIDLPSRTTQPFELAINGPQGLLREHGWRTVDAMRVSRTLVGLSRFHPSLEGRIRRRQAHLRRHADRDGSAIGRSATWPSGRPALVQDTGWTAHLPHGDGLLAFSTPDDALAAIDRINGRLRAPRAIGRRDRARALCRGPRPATARGRCCEHAARCRHAAASTRTDAMHR